MMAKSGASSKDANVSPGVIATVAVVLVLFIGFLAYRYFGPAPQSQGSGQLTANDRWLNQKAIESKAQLMNLSREDQQTAFSKFGSSAPSEIAAAYAIQQKNK